MNLISEERKDQIKDGALNVHCMIPEPRTLLHPLEAAARFRSQPVRTQRMSATLMAERQRQDQVAAQSMQLKRDTEQQQRDWE